MQSKASIFCQSLLLVVVITCVAKPQVNEQTGIQPFGRYHGGDIDKVGSLLQQICLDNGNLAEEER